MFTGLFGTLEGTRTPDLLVRSQSLYPAELPAHTNKIYQLIQLLTKYPQVDLVFRSQSLYPAELPAHTNKIYQLIQLLTKYPQVDLVFRSQSLYPAELPARICVALFVL